MGKLSRSWELFKISATVTNRDRELTLLPLVGVIISLFVIAPAVIVRLAEGDDPSGLFWVLVIAGSFVIGLIFNFLRASQMLGAKHRLEGGDPTIGSSIGEALGKFWPIFRWGVLATSVSMALALIRAAAKDRGGQLAVDLATKVLGAAWNVISFLALPIAAFEGLGAFKSLKRSKDLLKKTWGENLVANIGAGIIVSVALIPGVAVGVLAIIFLNVYLGIVILWVWITAVSLIMGMITAVYQTALYLYAVTGQEPSDFAGKLTEAFKRKKTKAEKKQERAAKRASKVS